MPDLFVIGISHRTASIDIRERLWFSKEEIRNALPQLKDRFFRECVLLSTCNRTELYGFPRQGGFDRDNFRTFFTGLKNVDSVVRPEHFYNLSGRESLQHLFRVATGIDSMIPGDVQILGQVKQAYSLARECGTLGLVSSRLFQSAFHAGKRSRAETGISEGAVSISYGAVELAGKIYADLHRKTALLLGAGKTSELTLKHLRSKGIGRLYIANRTVSKALELAERFEASVLDFDSFKSNLHSIDILISSVSSPEYILTSGDLTRLMKERENRAFLIIDLGVPRNIDPTAKRIENVFLHDIDTFKVIVDNNLQKRHAEIPKVEKIIEEELSRFLHWKSSLEVNPTIEQLEAAVEAIRQKEIDKYRHRFRPEEHETLELLTRRIINKILHPPLVTLRQSLEERDDEGIRIVALTRRLFGLPSQADPAFGSIEDERPEEEGDPGEEAPTENETE